MITRCAKEWFLDLNLKKKDNQAERACPEYALAFSGSKLNEEFCYASACSMGVFRIYGCSYRFGNERAALGTFHVRGSLNFLRL
jgi:hypothetical protein